MSNAGWINIISGSSGTGNGVVQRDRQHQRDNTKPVQLAICEQRQLDNNSFKLLRHRHWNGNLFRGS